MMDNELRAILVKLQEFALALPGAYEEFPWGERVVKVGKKVFVFLGKAEGLSEDLAFSVKLPVSNYAALELSFTEPAGYGLGKSGWVAVTVPPGTYPSVELFLDWIEESYRAIAPKKLVAQISTKNL
jgi:predicted DNA-binding protein (MmcQ/YjbR family)